MTRADLKKRLGNPEIENIAIDLILSAIKMPLYESIVKNKIAEIDQEIADLEEQGYIYTENGTKHVAWTKENEPYERTGYTVWNAPVKINKESEENRKICDKASRILYDRNLYRDMLR